MPNTIAGMTGEQLRKQASDWVAQGLELPPNDPERQNLLELAQIADNFALYLKAEADGVAWEANADAVDRGDAHAE